MKTEILDGKTTIAKGVMPDKKTHTRFLKMLKELELSKEQHHAKPMETSQKDGKFHVTLYIKDHADFLIMSSLKDGMLRHWGDFFELEKHDISLTS